MLLCMDLLRMFVLTVVAGAVPRAPVAPQLMHFWIFRCCQSLAVLKSLQIKFGFLRPFLNIAQQDDPSIISLYIQEQR